MLQLSPGDRLAIITDSVDNVRAIATDTDTALWETKLPNVIMALQLSPDGQLAIAEDSCGTIRAIATDTGAALWEATIAERYRRAPVVARRWI